MTVSRRTVDGKDSWESRLYVSSHPPRAKMLGSRDPSSLEHRELTTLGAGRELRRRRPPPAGPKWSGQPGRRPPLGRQPAAAGHDDLTRRRKCKRMACALDPDYLLRVFNTAKIDA
ncbi:MAG: hypothetical protein R3C02_20520 [Planctomycetaceae bacterium]